MTKILIISSLIPLDELESKKNENDILLVIEDELKKRYDDIDFSYLFLIPFYIHEFIFLFFIDQKRFKRKWREYNKLKQKEYLEVKGRKVYLIPMINFPYPFFFRTFFRKIYLNRYKKRINNLIEIERPAIIHAQDVETDAFVSGYIHSKYDLPYLVTMRGLRRGYDRISVKNIKNASAFIAISPNQLKMGSKITDNKIVLLPHGINNIFFTKSYTKDSIKSDLELVYIGNLIQRKYADRIIKAISKIENINLTIIGSGPAEEDFKALSNSLGLDKRIKFLGRIEQEKIPPLLSSFDLFVMPSKNETLGRVYFEAMASGLPIIGSKGTGIDGIVKDGKEGFLITPGSVEDLENTLRKIKANPHLLQEMKTNAIQLAEKYTWDNVSRKYYELYSMIK